MNDREEYVTKRVDRYYKETDKNLSISLHDLLDEAYTVGFNSRQGEIEKIEFERIQLLQVAGEEHISRTMLQHEVESLKSDMNLVVSSAGKDLLAEVKRLKDNLEAAELTIIMYCDDKRSKFYFEEKVKRG